MNPHDRLLSLLNAYVPTEGKETADLERMKAYATSLENPLSRKELSAHFTGSAIVVHPNHEQVCLVFHGKYHRWIQLGGHGELEDDGDIAATALREAKEESGLEVEHFGGAPCLVDIDIHPIAARGEEPEHFHLDMRFLIQATTETLKIDPNESDDLQWKPWEEAKLLVIQGNDNACARALEKARQRVLSQ